MGIIDATYVDAKDNSIKVCWGNIDQIMESGPSDGFGENIALEPVHEIINNQTKELVKTKIQEQFSLKNVGIEFIGWNECTENDKDNLTIKIFAFRRLSHVRSQPGEGERAGGECDIGKSWTKYNGDTQRYKTVKRSKYQTGFLFLRYPDNDKEGNIIVVKEYPEDHSTTIFIRTALHEFGHGAGLHHEHYNEKAKSDPNCERRRENDYGFYKIGQKIKVNVFTDYDSDSVMNYCRLDVDNNNLQKKYEDIKLSLGDIKALRCTYMKNKMPTEYCKSKRTYIE